MDASIILLEGLLLARKQNSSALWLYIHFLLLYVKGTERSDGVGGDLHAHHTQQWAWRLANVSWYGKCSKCQWPDIITSAFDAYKSQLQLQLQLKLGCQTEP